MTAHLSLTQTFPAETEEKHLNKGISSLRRNKNRYKRLVGFWSVLNDGYLSGEGGDSQQHVAS